MTCHNTTPQGARPPGALRKSVADGHAGQSLPWNLSAQQPARTVVPALFRPPWPGRVQVEEGVLDFITVQNGPIDLNVAVEGRGPLILCVHGFPELWYSWRHQIAHFSKRGYKVAAMDVRGYGGSSKPHEITAYSIRQLASDTAAAIDQLGGGTAILFGHDWGAPIVWNTALLYPNKVKAVAGLSVPYIPRGPMAFIEMAKAMYKDRFFYQLYFQEEGVAEAEFQADIPGALRKLYFAASGGAPVDKLLQDKPADAKLLDGMI